MKRALLLATVVTGASTLLVDLSGLRVSAQRPEMRSLASLYDVTTGAIRDTNGDGLAD